MRFCDTFQTFRRPRHVAVAVLLAGFAISTGCDNPDPEGRFNGFGDKTADRRGSADMGDPDGGQQVDFSGSYLLSLATTLAPTSPLYIQADVMVDTSDFTIDFVFQPLKTDNDGATPRADARTAVGPAITVTDIPLSASGQFEVDLGVVEVDGSANPISGGDIVANIQLKGFVLSTSKWCGTASGDVTAPTMLPLAGSTFGTVKIDGDITAITPVAKCEGGVVPGPDMGGDMGGDMGDVGPPAYIRCPAGLEGSYDLLFKADVSSVRTQVTMTLVAGDGMNSPCYTGEIISQSDGTTVVGTVEFMDDKDTVLTAFVPDFMIPPGASPILPNGGVAALELRASAWNATGACGELTFALESPAITSEGGFLMLRQGNTEYTIAADTTMATCDSIVPVMPCGLDAWAGTYQLKFISETTANLGGMPSLVEMNLAPHPLTCLTGDWSSLTVADLKLADVAQATQVDTDQAEIRMRNFIIPPDPNNVIPFLRDGGRADVVLRTSMSVPGTSFCGSEIVSLFEPAEIMSAGTINADQTEPATAACP